MLRVGYTSHDGFPSPATNTQQTIWTLVEVARLGVEVTMTIPAFRDSAGGTADVAAYYGMAPRDVPETFHITAMGRRVPRARLAVGWFDWRLGPRVRRSQSDVTWTRDPVAAVSLLRAGLPTVFETYREDLASRARFSPWRAAVLGNRRLLGVITHSRLASRAFVAAGVPEARCLIAYNGFAPVLMTPVVDRARARSQLDLPFDARLVVYTGHIGADKGTDVLVDLAVRLPEARFVLVGPERREGDAARLETRARTLGAANLVVHPHVPLSQVSVCLYAADCLIIPPTDEPLTKFARTVLPMKAFSYLAAGRAIVAPRLPDIEEVLTDGETACLVSPTDVDDAAHRMRALLADPARMDRLAARARQFAQAFTWEARARRIVVFLRGLSGA